MFILGKPGPESSLYININLFQPSDNKLSSRQLGEEGNSEIVTISNQYKDTLDDLIDSSDPEPPKWLKPILQKPRNAPRPEDSSSDLLDNDCSDENVPDRSLQMASKTGDLVLLHHIVVARVGHRNIQK